MDESNGFVWAAEGQRAVAGGGGSDATACMKSTCFNMAKAGYIVHVLFDCITSYDLKKLPDMLDYYANKGCEVKTLAANK